MKVPSKFDAEEPSPGASMYVMHRACLSWLARALQSEQLTLERFPIPLQGGEHVPFGEGSAAFAAGARLSSHHLFGARIVKAATAEDIAPVAFFASTAATVRAGLSALTWAFPLITNAVEIRFEAGERPRLTMRVTDSNEGGPWLAEALLGCLFGHASRLLNGAQLISGVTVAHPVVAREVFLRLTGAAPREAQGTYALELCQELLDAPLPRASSELHDYLYAQLSHRIAHLSQTGDWVTRLRFVLSGRAQLSADCLIDASYRLGLSPRTLQRKLSELGTTFSEELEKSRRERAYQWVLETRLPLRTIARRIGFSDSACFSRAFRRWYHVSPASFRRRGQPRPPDRARVGSGGHVSV